LAPALKTLFFLRKQALFSTMNYA